MKKYILSLGLNDKNSKRQEISTLEAFKVVSKMCADKFGGSTIYESRGSYRHDDGTMVHETTLRIEICFAEFEQIKAFAQVLKVVFNQETILVEVQTVESELI